MKHIIILFIGLISLASCQKTNHYVCTYGYYTPIQVGMLEEKIEPIEKHCTEKQIANYLEQHNKDGVKWMVCTKK